MPGGVLQLAAYGAQDFYLTGNPQISFFKTVYRRYTNFAMEFYSLTSENNIGLSENDISTYVFDIRRHGDLISEIYFEFKLPNIYSEQEEFRWIKNIGFNIINKVSIYIGGSLIDENYGEWFDIWNELTLEESKRKNFNEMIGNVKELYDPSNAPGNNGYYPYRNKNDTFIPSIIGRKIRVPLIFWFNRNSSLAIPLVALQYHPVEIHIEIKKISDLYTVLDTDTTSNKRNKRIKPLSNIQNYSLKYSIQNFTNQDEVTYNIQGTTSSLINFSIDPILLINYVFLDKEEMNKFAKSEHKFLIQQVRRSDFKSIINNTTLTLQLQHPTSFLVIVCKRSDVEDRNDWNNYTNWIDEDTPPYTDGFYNPFYEEYSSEALSVEKIFDIYENFTGTTNDLKLKFDSKKTPYILKSLLLKLNGTERFSENDSEFFNYLESNSFSKRIPKKGILFYSFSLNPFEYQPSGTCNFSRFNNIELSLETVSTPIPNALGENLYKFDINVYSVNYNILRIISGMGNLEFAN